MRVLFICPGTAVIAWEGYIKEVKNKSDDFLLVGPQYAKSDMNKLGVPNKALKVLPFGKWAGHIALDIYSYKQLEKTIKDFTPDVVHVMGEAAYQITYLTSKIKSKNNNFLLTCRAAQNVYQVFPFPFNKFEKYSLGILDNIFSLSNDSTDILLKKQFKNSITHLYNGYDHNLFSCSTYSKVESTNNIRFGYFGKITERKGIFPMLHAFKDLKQKGWSLDIVGHGDLENDVRDYVNSTSFNGFVSIEPKVSRDKLAEKFKEIDILILPSIDVDGSEHGIGKIFKKLGVKWKEQFGRIIVEAMGSGVPTIGTNSGAIPDVVGDSGWIINQNDPDELRKLIEELLIDNQQINCKKNKALKRSELFKWEVIAKETTDKWYDLLNK